LKRVFCICISGWPKICAAHVGQRLVDGALQRGHPPTAMISRSRGSCSISWRKPWPSSGAQQVLAGHAHVVEEQLAGVDGVLADLVQQRPRRKPFCPAVSAISRLTPLPPAFGAGAADDADQVGVVAVGDEGLGAVDDVVVTVAARALVRTACRSVPAPGSVIAMAATISPLAIPAASAASAPRLP
jgi:hypothetical protein